jgi:hypothetical protein
MLPEQLPLPVNYEPAPHVSTVRDRLPAEPILRAVLCSPLVHSLIDRRVCLLRYRSAGGRYTTCAVTYAESPDGVLVIRADGTGPAHWWRALGTSDPVQVLLHRRWQRGHARMVACGRYGWRAAREAYLRRFPHRTVDDADLFVLLTVSTVGGNRPAGIGASGTAGTTHDRFRLGS